MSKRFIFKNLVTEFEDTMKAADEKASAAYRTAEVIIDDPEKNMAIIMIVSFDLGNAGLSFCDLAQFLYDNYSIMEISSLYLAVSNSGSIKTVSEDFDSEKALEHLKKDAKDKMKKTEDKVFGDDNN